MLLTNNSRREHHNNGTLATALYTKLACSKTCFHNQIEQIFTLHSKKFSKFVIISYQIIVLSRTILKK